MFGLSKLYTIQQDQKTNLEYHMLMLFTYMAGGEGSGGGWGVRGLKMFCQSGPNFFYLLYVFVCVGGSGSVPLLP